MLFTSEIRRLSHNQRVLYLHRVVSEPMRQRWWTLDIGRHSDLVVSENHVFDNDTVARPCIDTVIEILPKQETLKLDATGCELPPVDTVETGMDLVVSEFQS